MPTITLTVPEHAGLDEKQFAQYVAAKLYEDGKVSLAHGAKIAGLSTSNFADILADYNVSIITYSAEDIVRDVNAI